jgi:transposase
MAWAAISESGERKITFTEGTIKADNYIEILNENLLDMEAIENCLFMHDLAPAHRAKKTSRWFDEYDIELFTWVAHSPDLNPIENVWAYLKD